MVQKLLWFTLILSAIIPLNIALRLLVFFPVPSKSHSMLGYGVVDSLLAAGHEVVHVTTFPRTVKNVNYTKLIDVSEIGQILKAAQLSKNTGYAIQRLVETKIDPIFIMSFVYDVHKHILQTPSVQELLSDPKQKFDGVIVEWAYSNYIAGIASLFQCPLIWFATTELYWQMLELIDEISNPALHVDLFSFNSPPLTFWQRTEELFIIINRYISANYYITPKEKSMYETTLSALAKKRGVVLPPYEDSLYNASLMLINSHPIIGAPYRLPQNAKYIAGLHISNRIKPLPQELQKLIDEAKYGVIYFSMGSNLKSVDMSENMKSVFLNLFAKLNETIIWKFEGDLENVPNNVHLLKWAPQESILGHPNVKFFMTHGGQLSTIEALHFGKPVIGIPVFGDQLINMKSVSKKGFGITVDLTEDTLAENLFSAINEMKTNLKYKEKAKELSVIYHNRQQSPRKELVYWVEYVIATGGAPHLRSPALSLPLYKKLYLDLLLLILFSLYTLLKIIRLVYKSSLTLYRRSGIKKKTK